MQVKKALCGGLPTELLSGFSRKSKPLRKTLDGLEEYGNN